MTDREQIQAFAYDLERLVDRYRKEFEITYAATVGVLYLQIHNLCEEEDDDSPCCGDPFE